MGLETLRKIEPIGASGKYILLRATKKDSLQELFYLRIGECDFKLKKEFTKDFYDKQGVDLSLLSEAEQCYETVKRARLLAETEKRLASAQYHAGIVAEGELKWDIERNIVLIVSYSLYPAIEKGYIGELESLIKSENKGCCVNFLRSALHTFA